jgi:hypothetical protein
MPPRSSHLNDGAYQPRGAMSVLFTPAARHDQDLARSGRDTERPCGTEHFAANPGSTACMVSTGGMDPIVPRGKQQAGVDA